MKKYFILLAVVTLLMSCGKTEKPTVVTTDVLNVTEFTAICTGNVESDGGAEVTAKGVCWSKEQNPTIEDNNTNEGGGIGAFTSELKDLASQTTYYVRAYATNEAGTAYGEEKSFTTLEEAETPENPEEPEEPENPEEPETPEEPELPTINGYEYVDLGLPSGLKWATHNVGASEPQEVGSYFAWGEVKSKPSFPMDSDTYGVVMGDISGDVNYDVAAASWGSSWRMPTEAEARELKDNCTFEWVMINNFLQGCYVKGPNGNEIYLPSGGFMTEDVVDFFDSEGAYWLSTPDPTDAGYSCFFYFYNTNFCNVGWFSRYAGLLVRPVSE